jgi:prepilin-type N-terminal cleavage/methylation domain-containing protein
MHQRIHKTSNNALERGFTLIEIIIAVMILAVSLITLLGMQSAATQTAIKTRNKQEAMLAARSILAGIEYAGNTIKNRSINGSASDIAKLFLNDEAVAPIIAQEKRIPLTANLVIEYWPMADLPSNAVQRITLTVGWGSAPDDNLMTYYFIAAKEP